MEGQVQEILMVFDLREHVCLQDVWRQQIKKLHAKALRVENYVFIEVRARTAVIRRYLYSQLAVLNIIVVMQHEETVPFDDLPRRRRLNEQTLRCDRVGHCTHGLVGLQVYRNIFNHEQSHVDDLEVELDLLLFAIKGVAHVDLQHVSDATDELGLLQLDVLQRLIVEKAEGAPQLALAVLVSSEVQSDESLIGLECVGGILIVLSALSAHSREFHGEKLVHGLIVLSLDELGGGVVARLHRAAYDRVLILSDEGVVFLGALEPHDHSDKIEDALNYSNLVLHHDLPRDFLELRFHFLQLCLDLLFENALKSCAQVVEGRQMSPSSLVLGIDGQRFRLTYLIKLVEYVVYKLLDLVHSVFLRVDVLPVRGVEGLPVLREDQNRGCFDLGALIVFDEVVLFAPASLIMHVAIVAVGGPHILLVLVFFLCDHSLEYLVHLGLYPRSRLL